MRSRSKTNKNFVILLLVTALLASSAFFFFPAAKAEHATVALAIAFAASLTQLLAGGLFLNSLRTFKRGLRVAYYLLSAGILLFSLSQIVPSFSAFSDILSRSTFLSTVIFAIPYVFGAFFMYLGMRKFAQLLKVHSIWGSFFFVLALSLLAGVAFYLLPHSQRAPGDASLSRTFDFIFTAIIWCGMFSAAGVVLALRIRKGIGLVYKEAIFWVAGAMTALVVTTLHEAIAKTYFADSGYAANSLSLWPFLLVGILFLRAGLAFRETRREFVLLPPDASYIDVVVGAAGLVSSASAVDEGLDKVRIITSAQNVSQGLSAEDKAALVSVYKYIENYLVTEEPLHKFSREGLRSSLPHDFLQDLDGPTNES